jgi:RHS repeat-associated protein
MFLKHQCSGSDAVTVIQTDGNGAPGCLCGGAVGNYYGWNGGWGYQYFSALGMYYVHGRWYDPNVGRFISPDAKGESIV